MHPIVWVRVGGVHMVWEGRNVINIWVLHASQPLHGRFVDWVTRLASRISVCHDNVVQLAALVEGLRFRILKVDLLQVIGVLDLLSCVRVCLVSRELSVWANLDGWILHLGDVVVDNASPIDSLLTGRHTAWCSSWLRLPSSRIHLFGRRIECTVKAWTLLGSTLAWLSILFILGSTCYSLQNELAQVFRALHRVKLVNRQRSLHLRRELQIFVSVFHLLNLEHVVLIKPLDVLTASR